MIYQQAILMLIATEGSATTAKAFDIEFWEGSPTDPDRDPDSLVAAFSDKLLTMAETTRR